MSVDLRISGNSAFSISESDIRINYSNVCRIIAAANNASLGQQQIFFSWDGGESWHQTTLPLVQSDIFHRDPSVDWTSEQTAWAVTTGTNDSSNPFSTGSVQLRSYESNNWGSTWNFEDTLSGAQTKPDKPMMWIDHSPTSKYRDNIYVIWQNFPIGMPNDAPGVFVNHRTGSSGTWQTPVQVSGAETTGQGSGVDIKSNSSGDVFAFWHDLGGQDLYVAKSTDGGNTWASPTKIWHTFGLDRVQIPSFASRAPIYITAGTYQTTRSEKNDKEKNFVYAAWMDKTGVSAIDCDNSGDNPGTNTTSACKTRIWFIQSVDGGVTWGNAWMINDQVFLNDQFNPRLVVDETNGQIVIAYYDTIGDPDRLKADIWMQTSYDNGKSWEPALKVTTMQTDETVSGADITNQYGDYIGLSGYAGTFFPSWTDRRSGLHEEIWTRRLRVPSTPEEPCSIDPVLTSATIKFHTKDDGKDHDTHLTIDVNAARGENAAHIDGLTYNDQEHNPFDDGQDCSLSLLINGPWFTKSRVQRGGYLRIRIDPSSSGQGSDTWKFDFTLDLTFSDSQNIQLEQINQSLNEEDDGREKLYFF
jgi:hypothetical protein